MILFLVAVICLSIGFIVGSIYGSNVRLQLLADFDHFKQRITLLEAELQRLKDGLKKSP